jgi:hypothetical protein
MCAHGHTYIIILSRFDGRTNFVSARVVLFVTLYVALSLANQRLDKNDLKNLPSTIADLPALLSLRFRENAIATLQECFTNLTTLQVTSKGTTQSEAHCSCALFKVYSPSLRLDTGQMTPNSCAGIGHVKE